MKRRHVLAVFGAAAAGYPAGAFAQQAKIPTIGLLAVESLSAQQFRRSFPQALRELGYLEGQNIRLEWRFDQGNGSRLPELAADLVQQNVDLIVTWLTPAAKAAKEATRDIPIVMGSASGKRTPTRR